MKRLSILVGAMLLLAAPAQALLIKMSVDEMAQRAEHIVYGQVVSLESTWNAENTTIFTQVIVRVDEGWKGTLQQNATVTLTVPGGEVDDIGIMSEHAPQFFFDEMVVLFLDTDERGQLRVAQDEQGKYTVAESFALNQLNHPVELDEFKAEIFAAIPGEVQR